jgi:hypothetical protein
MKGGLPEEFLKRWGDFGVLAGFESVDGRKEGAQKLKCGSYGASKRNLNMIDLAT